MTAKIYSLIIATLVMSPVLFAMTNQAAQIVA